MDEEKYPQWKKELSELLTIDEDEPDVDWEYVDHRIKMLRADISAYEEVHNIIKAAGVTEEMNDAEYWNTIAVYYDECNGDM